MECTRIYDCLPATKQVIIFPRCEKMLKKEADYISLNSPRQAEILKKQFREILDTIQRMPTMGTPYKSGIRRMKLGKFRYYVYYRELEVVIEIMGIHHTRRGTEFAG